MTKPEARLGDNGGRCESCNRDDSQYEAQTAYPVQLGMGESAPVMGEMWLCPGCLTEHRKRDAGKEKR